MDSQDTFNHLAQAVIDLIQYPDNKDFDEIACEAFFFQFTHNFPYAKFCLKRGVTPDLVKTWQDIPFIGNTAFKQCDLSCLSEENRTVYFQSSGTTQSDQSRHYHNAVSQEVYYHSVRAWFQRCFLNKNLTQRVLDDIDIISLTPPVSAVPHSSLAHMFQTIQPDASQFFGKVSSNGRWELNLECLLARLNACRSSDKPMVMVGTAFSFVHLLDHKTDDSLRLPNHSILLETGGYKGQSRELEKEDFHQLLANIFELTPGQIRTEYGMCELGCQGYDNADSQGFFDFPPWSRVRVVSPENGQPQADGLLGLIQVFDLTNIASVSAVQTSDLGMMLKGRVKLHGRECRTEPRGCSLFPA